MNFLEKKTNNPNYTQKHIAKELGFSDSPIKFYRNDMNMNSPYSRKISKQNSQSSLLRSTNVQAGSASLDGSSTHVSYGEIRFATEIEDSEINDNYFD